MKHEEIDLQVFVHRRHGYAGVIYGWDAKCGHSPDWAEKMQVKHDQPFYQVTAAAL